MLFSRKEVADYINNAFEPAWVSVRPVPIVTIDFGNDTKLTRTLHGNIATYICTADGQVLDVLPGIYEPAAYKAALEQLWRLTRYADMKGVAERPNRLREYHRTQAESLTKNGVRAELIDVALMSKVRVESGVKFVLREGSKAEAPAPRSPVPAELRSDEDLASWGTLAEDTRVNETQRRLQIHRMLGELGPVEPAALVKRLYKDVLHADLDDPYLGLGAVLFANYPFAAEDKR